MTARHGDALFRTTARIGVSPEERRLALLTFATRVGVSTLRPRASILRHRLPLERQVRMMAREGLSVESQTLWDQIQALARHLEPTFEALGTARSPPVINVDETAGHARLLESVGGHGLVCARRPSFYRILPGKSTDEGRQVLGGYVAPWWSTASRCMVLARDGLS
jgi:hypothetical protein